MLLSDISPMTHEHDRIQELQEHLLELKEDRDSVLLERDLKNKILRQAASWIESHAQHPPECALNKEGDCSCGLENLKKSIL